MNVALIGMALAIGAPGVKDPPKKDTAIVGEWSLEKMVLGGLELKTMKDDELRVTFTADGKAIANTAGKPEEGAYKLDVKKDPAEIDLLPAAGTKNPPAYGIFKIEGDTLSICVSQEKDARPTRFDSSKESKYMLMTFKRVKKS